MNFNEHPIEWDDAKVSRLWNYYSRTEPYSNMYFSKSYGEQILKASKLPLKDDIRVLDFGCGPGFIWEHVLRLGALWLYTGLDFSLDSISSLREKAANHPQFGGAQHVKSLPADLAGEMFDAVLLVEVVEHLNDEYLETTLAEIYRVLIPGGVVVITTPNNEDLSLSTRFCPECGSIFHQWQHVRTWSVQTLVDQVQKYKFQLKFASTLDFSAKGWVMNMAKGLVRRIFLGRQEQPHMIAVFQKI